MLLTAVMGLYRQAKVSAAVEARSNVAIQKIESRGGEVGTISRPVPGIGAAAAELLTSAGLSKLASQVEDIGLTIDSDGKCIILAHATIDDELISAIYDIHRLEEVDADRCSLSASTVDGLIALPEEVTIKVSGAQISLEDLERLLNERKQDTVQRDYTHEEYVASRRISELGGDTSKRWFSEDLDVVFDWTPRGGLLFCCGCCIPPTELASASDLERISITDASVEAVIALDQATDRNLHVRLSHAKLTDASLESLMAVQKLRTLQVDEGSKISPEGTRKFRKARPDVELTGVVEDFTSDL